MHPFITVEGNCCILFNILPLRKDCRGANASSTPTESGIEPSVQVMLAETVCNGAEARKAENAFKEKLFQCLTDSVNPKEKKRHKISLLQSQML